MNEYRRYSLTIDSKILHQLNDAVVEYYKNNHKNMDSNSKVLYGNIMRDLDSFMASEQNFERQKIVKNKFKPRLVVNNTEEDETA